MPKFKLTATKTYDANIDDYDEANSVEDMIKIDEENIFDIISYSMEAGTLDVKIEVLDEQ